MYAVVATGGKQIKVEKGTEAVVEKLDAAIGDTIDLNVIFAADGDDIFVAQDAAGVSVTAEVLEHFQGEKVQIFKFKKRKGYKRLKGHRQLQTRIRITDVAAGGAKPKVKPAKAESKPAKAEEKAEKAPKAEVKAEKAPKAEKKAPKAEKKAEKAPKAEKAEAVTKVVVAEVEEAAEQCAATKTDGSRCTNKAKEGSKYCGVHAKKYDS